MAIDFNVTGQIGLAPVNQIGDNVMTQGIGFPLRPVSSAPGEAGLSSELVSQSNVPQNPAGLGVPMQIAFGGAASGPNVSISAAGAVTFHTTGAYMVIMNAYFARSTTPGIATVFLRFLIDGAQAANPVAIEMDASGTSQFQQFLLAGQVAAGVVLTAEIIRDSGDGDDGGLVSFTSTDGWGTAPSAIIRVLKF